MANQDQYGRTLFLEGFQSVPSPKLLPRFHFSKNASESAPYDEAWLQRLIMSQPSLLPIDQIEPAFADMVPICIELPVRSLYLDNLFVTPNGDLALVECKLWRNPEARRQVVAQIIEYAQEMSAWTYEILQKAIDRTKPLNTSGETESRNLYELVSLKGGIDESAFHDAVSRNLRRGRFLLLIVGDGIREGVESLTDFLQKHAGFHFTLGIVELALFEVPTGGYLVQPRVLARTTNVDRGIVTMDEGGRIAIKSPSKEASGMTEPTRRTITQERYYEKLGQHLPHALQPLNGFIDSLSIRNVSPEFGTDSMILRWRPDGTRSWNLGTIMSSGEIFMDYLGQQANNAGLLELSKQYIKYLAELVPDGAVKKTLKETAWNIVQDGKPIKIEALLADQKRRDGWLYAIDEFQKGVVKAIQEE